MRFITLFALAVLCCAAMWGKRGIIVHYGDASTSETAFSDVCDVTFSNGCMLRNFTDGNSISDAFHSKKGFTINRGPIEAITYDDAINAAQNITINGGMVYCYASGNDGMDSNGTININGGVVIASGQIINIQQSGETILTYKMPRSYNSCCLLFSSPKLASGTTYTIYKGGSVSGGTEFNGYVDGGTYTAGTQATTFSPSSMVTTIGSSSSGRPW